MVILLGCTIGYMKSLSPKSDDGDPLSISILRSLENIDFSPYPRVIPGRIDVRGVQSTRYEKVSKLHLPLKS